MPDKVEVTYLTRTEILNVHPRATVNANRLANALVESGAIRVDQTLGSRELSRLTGLDISQVLRTLKMPGFVQVKKNGRTKGFYYLSQFIAPRANKYPTIPELQNMQPTQTMAWAKIIDTEVEIKEPEVRVKIERVEVPARAHAAFANAADGHTIIGVATFPEHPVTLDMIRDALSRAHDAKSLATVAQLAVAAAVQEYESTEVK